MELSEIQKKIRDEYLEKDRETGELFMMTVLVEEVGELARAIRDRSGHADEIADVFIALSGIANLLDEDMEKAILEKLERNRGKDWEDRKYWMKDQS